MKPLARTRRLLELLSHPTGRLYVLHRCIQYLSLGKAKMRKYVILAQPVPDRDLTPERRGRSINIHELSAEELSQFDLGRPPAVVARRLTSGGRCVAATRDGNLLGFQWFTLQDYEEDEVRCLFEIRPEDGCAWDYDIYVHPSARALPVFTRLWDHTNRTLRSEGITTSLSRVDALHGRSLRSHARLHARPICGLFFLIVGPVQVAVLPFKPWLVFTGPRGSGPTVPVSRLTRRARGND